MDDLLIVILTLIVALVGFFGKKKQKENQAPKPQAAQQPKDFWDVLMQEESATPTFTETEESAMAEEPEKEEFVEPVSEPSYSFQAEAEGKSEMQRALERPVTEKRKKVKIGGEEFSLKKAVIYNEILNRKYT